MAKEPEIGDLIEISRRGYQHWALYVGDGDVVHLGPASGLSKAVSGSVGSVGEDKAEVRREKLKDVVGQDKNCVNNLLDGKRKPRPIQDILRDAQSLVGEIRPYNLLTHNCEHFVTRLRYGTPESQQAQQAETFYFVALIGTVAAVGFTVIGAILKI